MDAAHTIFNQPIKVDLTYDEVDTPKHYRNYFDGKDLPEKLRAWRVHGQLKEKDYGLVSDGYGFEDSPECEFISGGINSKGPKSMALGRQGNWFLWGFCAPPEEMTQQARQVFVNTVAYMKQFDGQRPLQKRTRRAREWALNYVRYLDDERLKRYGTTQFAKPLLEACEGSSKKLRELLKENMGYLLGTGRFAIDADAKALGIPNRDVRLLDRCVELLEAGEQVARALRLLTRYTAQGFGKDAAKWRKWLGQNRAQLYFSDAAGYRFCVRPKAPKPAGQQR